MSAVASSEAVSEARPGAALLRDANRALWSARSVQAVAQIATHAARELLTTDGASLLELDGEFPLSEEPAAFVVYWSAARRVTDAERTLLLELAESTALALSNARVFEQLTQRAERGTQELIAANRELETFTYSVAHDLRSPLTCVVGFADLLERKYAAGLDEKGRQLLQEIVHSGQSMSGLIDGLLALAQQGRGVLKREPVDLSALAEHVLDELSRLQPERQLELSIEPHLLVIGDGPLLEVVLSQLFSNALKYTAKQARARIGLARALDQPHAFVVHDNGVGFDPASASRLFAPFQRLHSQAEFPGVGVGLATVARIVRKHGGSVWADAQEGKGASFFFSLPPDPSLDNPSDG